MDMDQIKNFKFKNRQAQVPAKEMVRAKEESPRDSLLNDIKKLGIEGNRKLRKVEQNTTDRRSRDSAPAEKPRNWTDDLNNKLKEMNKYMNGDGEDEDEEEDDESLTFENEFYNRT